MDFMDIRKRVLLSRKWARKLTCSNPDFRNRFEVTPFAIITDAETGVKLPMQIRL